MKWIRPEDCDSGSCLEIRQTRTDEGSDGHLLMRATELATGSEILVSRRELAAFITAAKAGQYDHLVQEEAVAQDGQF
jgi:hypothetical protein